MTTEEQIKEMIRVVNEHQKFFTKDYDISFEIVSDDVYLTIPMNDINFEEISHSGVIIMKERLRLYIQRLILNRMIDDPLGDKHIEGSVVKYKINMKNMEYFYGLILKFNEVSWDSVKDLKD